jgi:hypothetical protein
MMNNIDPTIHIACESVEWEFRCPMRWDELETTEDASTRYCDRCEKTVHYCSTVEELNTFAGDKKCIAWSNRPREQCRDEDYEPYLIGSLRQREHFDQKDAE